MSSSANTLQDVKWAVGKFHNLKIIRSQLQCNENHFTCQWEEHCVFHSSIIIRGNALFTPLERKLLFQYSTLTAVKVCIFNGYNFPIHSSCGFFVTSEKMIMHRLNVPDCSIQLLSNKEYVKRSLDSFISLPKCITTNISKTLYRRVAAAAPDWERLGCELWE